MSTNTLASEKLLSSSEENIQTRKNSTININEEQNMQRKETRYFQSYPVSCKYSDLRKWQIFDLLQEEFASQIHMIMAFNNDSALIMSKDKMVYGLGINHNGRLGFNKEEDYIQPEKVEGLCGKNIKTFYCNTTVDCFFALTEEGEVYSWGSNEYCRLGREVDAYSKLNIPGKLDSLSKECIIDIASNYYISLALTDTGKIYIWGGVEFSNKCSQSKPYQVKFKLEKVKIVYIACGSKFIISLSNDGQLYSWGINDYGQLGINSNIYKTCEPCLITSFIDVTIVKVVCGSTHSLVLTSEGKIYSWGSNDKGQLGHGKKCNLEKEPTMLDVPIMGKVSDIAAQDDKSVAINKIGCVYIWGFYICQTIWIPVKMAYLNIYDVFRYKIPCIIHDNTKEISNMLECLEPAFNDLSTSDLIIITEGHPIHVHEAILKIRSQYFRNRFQGDSARSNEITILVLKEFSYNVYKAFLKYLYTDVVDHLSLEETFELLKLCDEYNETDLKRKCIQIIKKSTNVSNVALYYTKAIKCNAKDLEEFCFQFALCHMTDVVQSETFAELNENMILFDFIIKAAKAGAYKA
ncbi:RCC1 and BTB domain-containing protein 1-like isoform X1 [Camponotus japonicus]